MRLSVLPDDIRRAELADVGGGGGGVVPTDADEVILHKADQAHALGFTGDGVRVAVIDTGLDFVHPDLFNASLRVTNPASPYYLHPVAYDGASMDYYLFSGGPAPTLPLGGESWTRSWWLDTSYSTTVIQQPDGTRWVTWTDGVDTFDWNVTGVSGLALGEVVRLSFHPDDKLLILLGMRPGVLLYNNLGAGAPFDSLLVDLDGDLSFNGEKRAYINKNWATFDPRAELISTDLTGDGVPDLSGGMVYFISDGVREIPYLRRQINVSSFVFQTLINDPTFDLWAFLEIDPTANLVPAVGDVVLLFGDFDDPEVAGSHGTWVASAIAGQGITGGGTVGPVLKGMAPDVKLIGGGNNFEFPSTDPFGQLGLFTATVFATEGYDATVGTGDEAHIASNSWGGADFTGWEWGGRLLDYVSSVHSGGRTAFVFAAGNSGPGYGGLGGPAGGASLIVAGAMENFYYRNDPWFNLDGGPSTAAGDSTGFSNRGPSAMGRHYIDAITSGHFGYGADPLNNNPFEANSGVDLNGSRSWILWAGTSLATPNLSGIVALIYQAYIAGHAGVAPSAATAKTIVKNSADDTRVDPLIAGAGIADAYRAVLIASETDGLSLSVDEWNPGNYRGTVYPSYATVLSRGSSSTVAVNLINHRQTATMAVNVETAVVGRTGSIAFSFTRAPLMPPQDFVLNNSGLRTTAGVSLIAEPSGLFASADSIRVSVWFDRTRLAESPTYLLDIFDWTDVNGNNIFDGFAERNLMFRDFISLTPPVFPTFKGPNGFGFIQNPDARSHDGLVLRLNPIFEEGLIAPVDFTLRVEYYARVPFPWLAVRPTSATIPARSSSSVGLTVSVPADADPGLYEATVLFRQDGNVTTLPVVVNVPVALTATVPTSVLAAFPATELYGTFGGTNYEFGAYSQGVTHGQTSTFDIASGDWRYFFFDLPRQDVAVIRLAWDSPNSTHELWALTNNTPGGPPFGFGFVSDWFSDMLPGRYGPGTEVLVGRSFSQVGNTTQLPYFSLFLNEGLNIVAVRSTFLAGTAVEEHPRGEIIINVGPAITNERPGSGTVISDASPTVSVDLRDPSGIFPFAFVIVDGLDLSSAAVVTRLSISNASVRLDLPFVLEDGNHTVFLLGIDNFFGFNTFTWTFVVDTVPPNLVITSPTITLTNNPSVTIAGTTEPGASVTINGNAVTVGMDGAFTSTQTPGDGPHTFAVVATDAAGNARSATVVITVDTAAPALSVTGPSDGALVAVPIVTVAGTTEAGVRLVVNGVVVAVASDGSFSFQLALKEGSNVIAATATDAAGNSASKSVTVTYANPVPGLEQSLAALATQALFAILILVVAFSVVMFLLYWNLNRKIRGQKPPGSSPSEEEL